FISFMQNRLSVRLPRVWQRFMKAEQGYNYFMILTVKSILTKTIMIFDNIYEYFIPKTAQLELVKALSKYIQKVSLIKANKTLLQDKLNLMVSEEDKLLLKMKFINGLTYLQIAEALDVSASSVNRRFRKILAILERYLIEQGGGLDNIKSAAKIYKFLKMNEQALYLYERILYNIETILGEKHPMYLTALKDVLELYKIQGEHEQVLLFSKKILEAQKEILGTQHPDYKISSTINNKEDEVSKENELYNISDDEVKFRVFIGLYFSLLSGYLLTEGFIRYTLLEVFPISFILFLAGILFPRLFGSIIFISVFAYLYYLVSSLPNSI
ncbi:MAG: sigma factor-like helix-turn-helix DNA-binding protein, partial [Thiotrichaceae bacterium]|nr:sigma factor-like helix-turn-helix DNA-binding protein [Thiotrichaceae bacterium]